MKYVWWNKDECKTASVSKTLVKVVRVGSLTIVAEVGHKYRVKY